MDEKWLQFKKNRKRIQSGVESPSRSKTKIIYPSYVLETVRLFMFGVERIGGARVRKEGRKEGRGISVVKRGYYMCVYIYMCVVYTRRLRTNWESSIRYERSSFICTTSEYRVSRNC